MITLDGMAAHLKAWEAFADATPEGNRLAGGEAHNRTLEYIVEQLKNRGLDDAYTVERQP